MKDMIEEALYEAEDRIIEDGGEAQIATICDLKQSGYLTGDDGLVITLEDGREFVVTIQEV